MLPEEDERGLHPERVRTSSPSCWSSFRGLELEPVLSISQPNANKSERHYKFRLPVIVIFERNYSLNFINLINLSSCHVPVFLILDSVRDDYQDPCTYSSLTEWGEGKINHDKLLASGTFTDSVHFMPPSVSSLGKGAISLLLSHMASYHSWSEWIKCNGGEIYSFLSYYHKGIFFPLQFTRQKVCEMDKILLLVTLKSHSCIYCSHYMQLSWGVWVLYGYEHIQCWNMEKILTQLIFWK